MKENTGAVQVQLPVEVATFLLNEKRSDIHAVEQRMDISVILIPNVHLETPNYTIVRLRENEVGDSESVRSYELVEMPTEEEAASTGKPQEAKPMRQEAAVKGITPETPAPVAAVKEEAEKPGLFGRFKSWLGGITSKKEEPKVEATPTNRNKSRDGQPRRDRNDRGERGGRNRNRDRDQTRNTQADNAAKPQEAKSQDARPPREPRPPRPEREKPQLQQAQPQQPVVAEGAETATEPRSRRNRGRGGRGDRSQREPRQPRPENEIITEVVEATVTQAATQPVATVEAVVTVATPRVEKAVEAATPAVQVTEAPIAEAPAQSAPETTAEDAPAKAERKPRAPRRAKAAPKPIVADLASAGLEMVETRSEAVQQAVVAEEPAPRKSARTPAWKKKAEQAQATQEPLMMVETQK